MAEDIGAVGEAVTGGMAARAVEPDAGEAGGHGASCLNCGTALVGDFCHSCGQKAHVHRTLSAFGHDLLHSVLHFDGKFWRTLPLLAWRPGELTRRYVEGERARFVSPMALFLFSVFLMFAIFSALGGPFGPFSSGDGTSGNARVNAQREFEQERAETLREIDRLKTERAERARTGAPTAGLDAQIAEAEQQLALEERLFRETLTIVGSGRNGSRSATQETGEDPDAAANVVLFSGAESINQWFNNAYRKARENPSLLFYKLQTNAYKFSWALIPISVPFLWLLFLHRRRYRAYTAYDHTVFVTYSIAFMGLSMIALTVLRPLGLSGGFALTAIMIVPPIHMYRQLRGAYALSRWSAVWRTVVLLTFAIMAGGLFFALLLTLGLLG